MSGKIECPVCGHEITIKKDEKTEEDQDDIPEFIAIEEEKTYTIQDYDQTCNEIDEYFKEKEENNGKNI